MKRFIIAFMLLFFSLPTFAIIVDTKKDGDGERIVNEIGYRILNANRIPYKITFYHNKKDVVNARASYRDKSIDVYRGIFLYADDLEEIAAVIAHEISHAVDYNQGAFRGYFSYLSTSFNTKKYEIKADKRAVDYLVKAGYNPLASITMLNKIASQPRFDWCSTHPLTSKRMAEIYEYIYTKYPQYLVQNKYEDNIYYQNFLLTSKENRAKFERKVRNNSKGKVNYL